MPIVQNRAYNNPEIGAAFSNLASLFAPPSAQDTAAYAMAKSRNAETSRLQWLFDNPLDATASERAALTGVQNFAATPDGFNISTDTLRRGQDMDSADKRFEVGVQSGDRRFATTVGADTILKTNAADNTRALTTNAADNAAMMERQALINAITREDNAQESVDRRYNTDAVVGASMNNNVLDNKAKIITQSMTPLNPGQIMPGLSADVGAMVGMPEILRAVGAPELPSKVQVEGQILNGLTPEEKRRTVMGSVPIETVAGPDGKGQILYRDQAVGQQPYVKPDTTNQQTAIGVMPDGAQIPLRMNLEGQWVDTQTGALKPAEAQIMNKPQPTGTTGQLTTKRTEFNDRNGMFASRAEPAHVNMTSDIEAGYRPDSKDYELILGVASGGTLLPTSWANQLTSDKGRKFYSNATNFMMSVLRPDTGAAFGKDEFQSYARVFIPMPGDDDMTLRDKEIARKTALEALKGASAGAYEQVQQRLQANGLAVPDEFAKVVQNGGAASAPAAAPAPAAAAPTAARKRVKIDADGNIIQ